MAEKMREYEVVVEGRLPFPLDMLRYDACYPAGEDQSYIMSASIKHYETARNDRGVFQVKLRSRRTNRAWAPTAGRWNSFSWTVVSHREMA